MKLTPSQQHPMADQNALQQLQRWQEHAHAPQWNWECGDRLDAAKLEVVRDFARQLRQNPHPSQVNSTSKPTRDFAMFCAREVPFYRERLAHLPLENATIPVADWNQIPFCTRGDLAREVWHFVPDERELNDMIVYWTSGTTGSEVHLPAPHEWASLYLPWFERALQMCGMLWPIEPDRVAFATIAAQEHTLTYLSPSSYLNGAMTMKVNLHPSQWRDADDAMTFLNEANPQIVAGDPVSLQVLAETHFDGKPLAVFSSALQLEAGLRQRLQARFNCPILDIYSSNETGPVACSSDGETWHLPDSALHLEIVRENGTHCEEDEVGEIVATTNRNSLLPLLRYRTGDFACYQKRDESDVLRDFHGRAPIKFQTPNGETIHSLDVTHALRHLFLSEFSLHQNADNCLHFRFRGGSDENEIRNVLQAKFPNTPLQIEILAGWPQDNRKLVRYSSDLEIR